MRESGSESNVKPTQLAISGFEYGRGMWAEKSTWPLEARKDKKTVLPRVSRK